MSNANLFQGTASSSWEQTSESNTVSDDWPNLIQFLEADFTKNLTQRYSKNLTAQQVDLGFNVFSLVSDTYYHENFHSQVLGAFLDPSAAHKFGALFLETFLTFLNQGRHRINLEHYRNAKVELEVDLGIGRRIDILITDKTSGHAVIIENKINRAVDQHRQIPYLQAVEKAGYPNCDTVVCLRLSDTAHPDKEGWSLKEKEKIRELLLVVPAYDRTPTDLHFGWIQKCIDLPEINGSDAAYLLRQYGRLIQNLGKDAMNKPLLKEFYDYMLDETRFQTAGTVKKMLEDLIRYRVERIREHFESDHEPFSRVFNHQDNGKVVCFDGLALGGTDLRVNIAIEVERSLFCFWDYNDQGKAEEMLIKMNTRDGYSPNERGWFVKEFKFPEEEAALYEHIKQFKKRLPSAILPPGNGS